MKKFICKIIGHEFMFTDASGNMHCKRCNKLLAALSEPKPIKNMYDTDEFTVFIKCQYRGQECTVSEITTYKDGSFEITGIHEIGLTRPDSMEHITNIKLSVFYKGQRLVSVPLSPVK